MAKSSLLSTPSTLRRDAINVARSWGIMAIANLSWLIVNGFAQCVRLTIFVIGMQRSILLRRHKAFGAIQ